jgi:acid phosphatase (class A)
MRAAESVTFHGSRVALLARGLLVALCLLSGSFAVSARETGARPYITGEDLDLTLLLPPPPPADSDRTKGEIAEILKWQVTRTPAMEERAKADAAEEIWVFADVLGPALDREALAKGSLPLVSALFNRILASEPPVTDPAKAFWSRARPHMVSDLVRPIVPMSRSGSWPSGHGTVGMLLGIVLSAMVPERRYDIMQRAYEYGRNRVIAGIHYPSDIETARIAGALIAREVMRRDDFKAEFEPAKAEIRAALGL